MNNMHNDMPIWIVAFILVVITLVLVYLGMSPAVNSLPEINQKSTTTHTTRNKNENPAGSMSATPTVIITPKVPTATISGIKY